jgi:DNA-binding transcriptional regulator GbsR (MarR family)
MRFALKILIFAVAVFSFSCAEENPSTPFETFKTYTKAVKRKDIEAMKSLLSDASIKMHEQEAKAQNSNLEEIVKRQTLFGENQTELKYRNEKIEGDRATLEIMNAYSMWQKVPFIKENGVWKIDNQGFADQMMQEIDQKNKELDNIINQGKQP